MHVNVLVEAISESESMITIRLKETKKKMKKRKKKKLYKKDFKYASMVELKKKTTTKKKRLYFKQNCPYIINVNPIWNNKVHKKNKSNDNYNQGREKYHHV